MGKATQEIKNKINGKLLTEGKEAPRAWILI